MTTLPINQIICGDCLEVMKGWPDGCIDMCVTSPPYWALRDYGVDGQYGLEDTPEAYVEKMVEVFREVRRVLADYGTCWVNLGDSYWGGGNNRGNNSPISSKQGSNTGAIGQCANHAKNINAHATIKPKDLCGIPWRVALALQSDGWWLRQDIIWSKSNPMPESATDRCTKAHEYIFLLSKKAKYYYDADAIREEGNGWHGSSFTSQSDIATKPNLGLGERKETLTRNRRSVWHIATQPTPEAHFATYPEKLIEPCILAGCPKEVCTVCGKPRERVVERVRGHDWNAHKTKSERLSMGSGTGASQDKERINNPPKTIGFTDCGHGSYRPGIVMDPFGGSGTSGRVAAKNGRDYVLIELNPEYVEEIAKPMLKAVDTGVPAKEARAGQMALFEGDQ